MMSTTAPGAEAPRKGIGSRQRSGRVGLSVNISSFGTIQFLSHYWAIQETNGPSLSEIDPAAGAPISMPVSWRVGHLTLTCESILRPLSDDLFRV